LMTTDIPGQQFDDNQDGTPDVAERQHWRPRKEIDVGRGEVVRRVKQTHTDRRTLERTGERSLKKERNVARVRDMETI